MSLKNLKKSKLFRAITIFLIIIILVSSTLYLMIGSLLFIFQDRFLYHPNNDDFYLCEGFEMYEREEFNGTRFFLRERNDSKKLIIYYHGNFGSMCERDHLRWRFERLRTNLMFVEYSGYANDDIKPNIDVLLQDSRNIKEFYKEKNYSEIIIIGASLGSGVASYHSSIDNIHKLILVAPFYSTRDLAKEKFIYYPENLIRIDDYTNNIWLQNFSNELLIIHGTLDENIPISQAEKLFDEIQTENKTFEKLIGAKHDNVYAYWDTYRAIRRIVEPEELPLYPPQFIN